MTSRAQVSRAAAVRGLYVLGLAIGTCSHASVLLRHGWRWHYGGMPPGTVLFWSSLTILDPLVAIMLFIQPRLGLALLLLLMLSDVAHNTWIIHRYGGIAWMLADQWLFLVFILATVTSVWRTSSPVRLASDRL